MLPVGTVERKDTYKENADFVADKIAIVHSKVEVEVEVEVVDSIAVEVVELIGVEDEEEKIIFNQIGTTVNMKISKKVNPNHTAS